MRTPRELTMEIEERVKELEMWRKHFLEILVPILRNISDEALITSKIWHRNARGKYQFEFGRIYRDISAMLLNMAHSMNFDIECIEYKNLGVDKHEWDNWLKEHGATPKNELEKWKQHQKNLVESEMLRIKNMDRRKEKQTDE